jgi:hypothetical protein
MGSIHPGSLTWEQVIERFRVAGYELVVDDEDGINMRGPIEEILVSPSSVSIRCSWLAVNTGSGWKLDPESPAGQHRFSFNREICSSILTNADGTLSFRVQYTGGVRLHPPGTIRPLEKPTLVAT